MKKLNAAATVITCTVIIVIGYQIGVSQASDTAATTPIAGGTTSSQAQSSTPSTSSSASTSQSSAPSSGSRKDGTFEGDAMQTRYGVVQVSVTIQNGKIVKVTPLHLTDDGQRSVSISNRAAPVLEQEVLQQQTAQVSGVSGATYTTEGYLTSLQSALDKA